MPYIQATELFNNPNATLTDLLDSFGDLEREYGYVKAMIISGSREDVETLWRIAVLVDAIKLKIQRLHL